MPYAPPATQRMDLAARCDRKDAIACPRPFRPKGRLGPAGEIDMRRAMRLLHALTAGDVMTRVAVVLPDGMSVAAAARLLLKERPRVVPVSDSCGRCVGVLSARGVLRWAADTVSAGSVRDAAADCVWCDWQVVDANSTRRHELRRYLTRDPLLVTADTCLAAIADALVDRPRPVVVVDEVRRPLGVLLKRPLLAALSSAIRRTSAEWPRAAPTDRRAPLRRLAQPSGSA